MNVDKLLKITLPKSSDCLNGHIGEPISALQCELDDDRYYDIVVTRCSHCGFPLDERNATKDDLAMLSKETLVTFKDKYQ